MSDQLPQPTFNPPPPPHGRPPGPPPPDEGMFVRVDCPACRKPDIFLKCDQCGRQALFSFGPEGVHCQCGATYSHATCSCGEQVPLEHLVAIPFEHGPLVASEMEIDPVRAGILGLILLSIFGGGIALLVWGLS